MTKQEQEELRARNAELEAENASLRAQLEALQGRVQSIEQELRRQHRQATPFARERPNPQPGRPGRKPGRGRFSYRSKPEQVDETIHVPLPQCPDCGGPLQACKRHEQFEQDLVMRVVTRRYVTESGYCTRCRRRQRSRHEGQVSDAQGAAGVWLGPRVRALLSDLKHRLGVPYEKIQDLLTTHGGLAVTRSGLCQADLRLAQQAEPVYQALIAALQEVSAVHVDETGWRIGILASWLWVFCGQQITVYAIAERRSHEVVVRVLGREFAGTLSCDCFTAYDHADLSDWLQQKCLAHLLKDLSEMKASKTGRAVQFAQAVTELLRRALKLRDLKDGLAPRFYTRERRALEADLDALVSSQRRFSDPDNRRMAKRLRKQRGHLLRFLYHDEVDPTNNLAERMLRPAVIMRKTCRCNKTARGAHAHQVLASLFVTCRQQQRNPIHFITDLLHGKKPSLVPAHAARAP